MGGDPALERFPASEALFLVLEHAQTWASKLKQPEDSLVNVVGEAAVLRAKLWQYVREQADAGQLKAIEDGRGRPPVSPCPVRVQPSWLRRGRAPRACGWVAIGHSPRHTRPSQRATVASTSWPSRRMTSVASL